MDKDQLANEIYEEIKEINSFKDIKELIDLFL